MCKNYHICLYIDDFMYKKVEFIEILGTYEFVGLIFDSS